MLAEREIAELAANQEIQKCDDYQTVLLRVYFDMAVLQIKKS